MSTHKTGLIIMSTGVIALSPDALLLKLIGTDPINMLFWRGMLMTGVLAIYALWIERADFKGYASRFQVVTIALGALHIVTNIGFLTAIQRTETANALLIIAITPLFAAVFGRLFMNERLPRITWISIVIVIASLAVILRHSAKFGDPVGDFAAVVTAIGMAIFFCVLRAKPSISNTQVFFAYGLMAIPLGYVFGAPLALSSAQMNLVIPLCAILMPLASILISTAPRYLPAAEVGLMMLLESVLGPLIVWLFLDEIPAPTIMACGAVILVTLSVHALLSERSRRRLAAASYSVPR